ncbi:MAG: GNAT family acetyltransferase [bacterium]|jgi:hypothetical protein
MAYEIRQYSPEDREAVRQICCNTGFQGDPVDPLFSDRDVFADFFTRYYTDWEPETALVAEADGKVVGYMIGCSRSTYHWFVEKYILFFIIVPKVIWRFLTGKYSAQDRKFLYWSCWKASGETPRAPGNTPHFHFNILPEYRDRRSTYKLVFTFMDMLARRGHKQVYGQIQTYEDRRPLKTFERYGFYMYDQREVSKFQAFQQRKVYVTTFVKELN